MTEKHSGSVEERIKHIADLMRRLQFVRGKTVKRLALEWNLTEQRVRELSAEASKRVKAELSAEDKVALTGEVVSTLTTIMRRGRKGVERGDLGAAASAAKTGAEIAGILAPKKVEARIDGLAGLFAELEQLKSP